MSLAISRQPTKVSQRKYNKTSNITSTGSVQ